MDKEGKLKEVIAYGHVRYKDKKYEAVGNIAIYIPSKKLIIVKGNAVVKSDKGIIKGDKIVYNLATDTFKAESKHRVQSVFQIEEKR